VIKIMIIEMLVIVVVPNFSATNPSPQLSLASPASACPSARSNPSLLSTSDT
jgi:hypothetical protein